MGFAPKVLESCRFSAEVVLQWFPLPQKSFGEVMCTKTISQFKKEKVEGFSLLELLMNVHFLSEAASGTPVSQ